MFNHFSRTALAVALAISFQPAFAASDDEAAVVVTATRVPTRISEVLSDVTTIHREDIERAGDTTLPELLDSLAGIQVRSNGGRGSNGALFVRGTSTGHTLILVDGQRLSSATTGTTTIENIPLDQVERIEILRGPASSLYGADAIGGVIRIETRRGTGNPAPSFSLGAGRYGTVIGSAAYGGEAGGNRFHVQYGGERSSGHGSITEAKGGVFDMFNPDDDPYTNKNFSASLSRFITTDLEMGGRYLRADSSKHYDSASCSSTFPWPCTPNFDNRQKQTLESFSFFGNYRIGPDWKTLFSLGQSRDDLRSWLFDPLVNLVTVERYDTRQTMLTWQNDLKVPGGDLMAAVEWRGTDVSSTKAFSEDQQDTRSFVLGYRGKYGNHSLQASARRDDISRLGGHNNGNLAYGYQFAPGWVARASIGTAYRAPTFNELYWPLDPANFFQGNPTLKPERSRNREIGISYDSFNTRAGITLYHNAVTDLIDFVAATAPPWISSNQNVGKATLQGATFEFAHRSGAWEWRGNLDVLSAHDDETDNFLQQRAPRSGSITARRHFEKLDVGLQLTATSERYNDRNNTQKLSGYGLVNLDANYQVSNEWTVFGRISNLFDKDYVQVQSTLPPYNEYAVPGRALFVGVRYAGK